MTMYLNLTELLFTYPLCTECRHSNVFAQQLRLKHLVLTFVLTRNIMSIALNRTQYITGNNPYNNPCSNFPVVWPWWGLVQIVICDG